MPPQSLTAATAARTSQVCRTRQRRSSCTPQLAHGFKEPALRLPLVPDAARVHRIPARGS